MRRIVLTGVLLMVAMTLQAGEIIQALHFAPNDLSISYEKGYAVINYRNYPNYDDNPGYPAVPVAPLYVVIPPSATVTGVEVVSVDEMVIPDDYLIMPAQIHPPFLPGASAPFVEPNQEIYSSSKVWPEDVVEYRFTGSKGGFRIGVFRIYPVRYIPEVKKLVFATGLTVRITYKENEVVPLRQTKRQIAFHRRDLLSLVANPDDISRFAPPLRKTGVKGSKFLPPGTYEHVILTPTAYKDTFQALADWRTRQGIPSRVFCIESTQVYPGKDIAERMRQFLQDADTTWGLIFAFIARQDVHSPVANRQYRRCWAQYSIYSDSLPCDLYYADLFRGVPPNTNIYYDWNGNKNTRYGEVADTIDYFSDIYVGMVTLDNEGQASHFQTKLLRHESNPDTLFFAKAILLNGVTFSDHYLNRIYDKIMNVSPPWKAVKMYQSGAGHMQPSAEKFRDSVNAGYGYTAIIGHGSVTYIKIPNNYTLSHVGQQNNYNKLNTIIAVCCHPGAFDQADECLAESMAVANGGFINVMMNSRFGWVDVAEYYNELFFYKFLPEAAGSPCSAYVYVGQALARVKDHLISNYPKPGQGESSPWKWETFEKNLFGDPANMLPNWSPVLSMQVDHPTQIETGPQDFTVSVGDNTYAPVEDALVCVMKEGEVYDYGLTDPSGQITFNINPQTPGTMFVTVTERNHQRHESTVTVIQSGTSEPETPKPSVFGLSSARPNPFHRTTTINYQIPKKTRVRITVYDLTGRMVRRLVDDDKDVGFYSLDWDGRNDQGVVCPSGVYFYRFESGDYVATKNLVIMR